MRRLGKLYFREGNWRAFSFYEVGGKLGAPGDSIKMSVWLFHSLRMTTELQRETRPFKISKQPTLARVVCLGFQTNCAFGWTNSKPFEHISGQMWTWIFLNHQGGFFHEKHGQYNPRVRLRAVAI